MKYKQLGLATWLLAGSVCAWAGRGLSIRRRRNIRSRNFLPSRPLFLAAIAFVATLFGQKINVTDPSPSLSNSKDITVSGRMMSLALSPNAKRVYAASPSGGLWPSTDGSIKWEQLTFDLPGDSRSTCVDADPCSCGLPAVAPPTARGA